MNIDAEKYKELAEFDNVLVTDERGNLIFYDIADLNILKELDKRPENFLGQHVTTSYKDLTNETSTIMSVLRSGEPLCGIKQEIYTKRGNLIISVNSTYPIKENNKIVGAVEFSKHFFEKDSIRHLDKYAGHKIYRKNNTVYTIDDIITTDPNMEVIKQQIRKVAQTDSTVLIFGKTGTGKEVASQAIHNLSDRYEKPFVSLNCGAVPPNLLESTLFGTVKGSFTGAESMPGLFEQANGGTLFLDEINSLDIYLQVKLLKAVEEKRIRRIGGKEDIELDIRVISATNEDPEVLLEEKRMREDLYYRLGVVQINLPTLSERQADIEALVTHYVNFYNNHMNIFIDRVQPEVMEKFKSYDWPGNVRELKNAIETAFNNANSHEITMEDIPARITRTKKKLPAGQKAQAVHSLKETVDEFEKGIIVQALEESGGIIAAAARQLGISKQSLKYKMDKYGLR
ncbi:sigma-54 interaction domain-containing protein [Bacillus thermotolerans]|uniref:Arginine utilization regulatory protein RocR n=1 Tax=Bacillus thermotolerans TaxID=1221996 RepID=A0A0F5I1Q5_BACTR|nr:sigma-54-dependent Fis family transcriptional regulator [Bacillus thermotolerans]KKB35388.1 Arginine utilization regulatory protein RocR [Bacillus thermotolerans]KKB39057.1 Arginine utilization regulatory protein RocR [Bacillus thermotolerans]